MSEHSITVNEKISAKSESHLEIQEELQNSSRVGYEEIYENLAPSNKDIG